MFNDTSIVLYGLLRWLSGKDPPTMQERWVQSLGRKDPLEKEMATHSNILAWKIPRTEELGGLQSMGTAIYSSFILKFQNLKATKILFSR